MASPISSTTGQPVNLHTNINRAKTRRWVEAKSYRYDGGDWGDEDEYGDEDDEPGRSQQPQPPVLPQNTYANRASSAGQYGELPYRNPGQSAYRSVTIPAPMHTMPQPPSGQGDDRRAFSTNIAASVTPYPTTQRPPFSQLDKFPRGQQDGPRTSPQRGPPPPSDVQHDRRGTTDQRSYPSAPFVSESRAGSYANPEAGPYPGQMPQQGRFSESSDRPIHGDIYGRRDSPSRTVPSPLSAVSQLPHGGGSGNPFPPPKSSMSQQAGPPDFGPTPISQEHDGEDEQHLESSAEPKPLPFPRPADIYRRMAEERERERRASGESPRPSLDDAGLQRQQPETPLDSVKERRSEHGTGGLKKSTGPPQNPSPSGELPETTKHEDQSGPVEDESNLMQAPSQSVERSPAAPDTRGLNPDGHPSDVQTAGTERVAEGSEQRSEGTSALRHNPSSGFTSVVHQAFHDSENKVPPTPSSTSGNSIVRSNSASASDISPIMASASSDLRTRPLSFSTITPTATQSIPSQEYEPLPPPVRPGFRRESRTPSPGNSPARRPISITLPDLPREESGVVSASTPTQSEPMRDRPSVLTRAESPTKGTVRDLADKLENRSRAASPVKDPASVTEVSRPLNPRLESFRPPLPGGWISYDTGTGASSPGQGPTPPPQSTENLPPEPAAVPEAEDDDIPTAGPPKPRERGFDASGMAFEALAAAGSALSGAFGTMTGLHHEDLSDNEGSPQTSSRDATPVRERPGGLSPVQEVLSIASSAPPTPHAVPHGQKTSQLGYFPPPLRTSRSNEPSVPMRPQIQPSLSTEASPQDTENDRLRKEIVRSLRPQLTPGGTRFPPDNEPEPVPSTSRSAASDSPKRNRINIGTGPAEEEGSWDEPVRREVLNASGGSQSGQDLNEQSTPVHVEESKEQREQDVVAAGGRPLLQKRFSWEAPSEGVGGLFKSTEFGALIDSQPQAPDGAESPLTVKARTDSSASDGPLQSNSDQDEIARGVDAQSTIIPVAESDESLQRDLAARPVATSVIDEARRSIDVEQKHEPPTTQSSIPEPPAAHPSPPSSVSEQADGQRPAQSPAGLASPRGLSFREILSLDNAQERIGAYNSARQQVATQDSGLATWLQATGSRYPEHHELLDGNGRLPAQLVNANHSHKPSPSRSKFPRVGPSLAQAGHQQPQTEGNDPSGTPFGSPSSSKLSGQQMQEEGKKLLHSAGKIGGKAGGAARGLFAKGKSKFRGSHGGGGGDKAQLSSRRTSPPMINVQSVQHSSGPETATATAAPQISSLPRVNNNNNHNNNETWSLSYAPSENISRSTTVDRPLPTEISLPAQPRYANLGPPGYPEDAVQPIPGLMSPPPPSPQVSALGSIHHDDIPSRSISEVTRPDEQTRNISPSRSIDPQESGNGTYAGPHGTEPVNPAAEISSAPRQPSSPFLHTTTPLADAGQSNPVPKHPPSEPQPPASAAANPSPPAADVQSQARPSETKSPLKDREPGTKPLSAGLEPRRSMVSAISSPSPGPPSPGPPSPGEATRRSVSPARQDSGRGVEAAREAQAAVSPPYEDATPPYSATENTKAAEAAGEMSLSASPERRQSLPAYQSPVQETPPPFPSKTSAIVPLVDLSARRRQENRHPSSRPFSFVDAHLEEHLHQHAISEERQQTSGAVDASLSKELGDGIDEPGIRPYSRSYSRPFNGVDEIQHPALRGSVEPPLSSQNANLSPPPRPAHLDPRSGSQDQAEQQYRIPGPYGQQFRSSKPASMPSDAGRLSPLRLPGSGSLPEREAAVDLAITARNTHRDVDIPIIAHSSATEHLFPGAGSLPHPPGHPDSKSQPHAGTARALPPRFNSRSSPTHDDVPDLQDRYYKEDKEAERVGSTSIATGGQHGGMASNQVGGRKGDAVGPDGSLTFYQRAPDLQGGDKTKVKGQKLSKKLQRVGGSNGQTQTEKKPKTKKKGGFLRLSGFFGKSNKDSAPATANEQAVPRSANLPPASSPLPPRARTLSESVPRQERASQQRKQDQAPFSDDQRNTRFRGQVPPVGGYYAPANVVAAEPTIPEPRVLRRDPESFIGGRRLSEQRAAEQARLVENLGAGVKSQNPVNKTFQLAPPPAPSSDAQQAQSAPPATGQHLDGHRPQQPRAVSQRFPLDLRIDTSGRVNGQRRSQPLPVAALSSHGAGTGDRPTLSSEIPTRSVPSQAMSSPQRHSPYADRNSQHSPYGYGSARGLRKDNLSHAIDLHKRSRSPRNGRCDSYDSEGEPIDTQDPASKLGTFRETNRFRCPPRGGEPGQGDDGQEKPWKLDLPGADDAKAGGGERADDGLTGGGGGAPRIPLGSPARNVNVMPPAVPSVVGLVELPGSKVPGDAESEEDIVMSSTTYPGQEWMPEMPGYGHWDDQI